MMMAMVLATLIVLEMPRLPVVAPEVALAVYWQRPEMALWNNNDAGTVTVH